MHIVSSDRGGPEDSPVLEEADFEACLRGTKRCCVPGHSPLDFSAISYETYRSAALSLNGLINRRNDEVTQVSNKGLREYIGALAIGGMVAMCIGVAIASFKNRNAGFGIAALGLTTDAVAIISKLMENAELREIQRHFKDDVAQSRYASLPRLRRSCPVPATSSADQ